MNMHATNQLKEPDGNKLICVSKEAYSLLGHPRRVRRHRVEIPRALQDNYLPHLAVQTPQPRRGYHQSNPAVRAASSVDDAFTDSVVAAGKV